MISASSRAIRRKPSPTAWVPAAQAVAITGDTGYFWFFNSSNVEVVIKVLNGCAANGHYWVFAGGLTDVRTRIAVTDTRTGAMQVYVTPRGVAFPPLQDTVAFATCP